MSLAKLTSLSTQTLSLLLERQRLQTFSPGPGAPKNSALHVPQITRNLAQLRSGILQLQSSDGRTEAVTLLRSQYERMRAMLGSEAEGVESLDDASLDQDPLRPSTSSADASRSPSPEAAATLHHNIPPKARMTLGLDHPDGETAFAPYADDPERGPEQPSTDEMLLQQRVTMDQQDQHLDALHQSINRQRDLSMNINSELEVHHGLLESLDHDLDHTDSRLSGARRRLDRFAKGVKGNGSTYTIALLIFILLILIIIFKT